MKRRPVAIVGVRIAGESFVTRISAQGVSSRLLTRSDLRNHAPRFAWGNHTPAAAQLALAILAEFFDVDMALDFYQDFKAEVLAKLPSAWVLESNDVSEWLLNRSYVPAEALEAAAVEGGAA